ncbi:hypothetical protein ACQ4WX_03320 [Streptomyces lasalocidi]
MGELDRSAAEFTGALTDYHRLGDGAGLALGAPALLGVGDVHRERGELGPARTAYQEAVVLAERSGDRQTLSAALTGLALSRGGGDPHSAAVLASRAALGCAGPPRIRALLAGGWIALTAGRCEAAAEAARQAAGEPGAQGSRAVFAELLELEAMCAVDPATRQALLGDAEEMWATAQRPMAVARVALARAQLEGAQRDAGARGHRLAGPVRGGGRGRRRGGAAQPSGGEPVPVRDGTGAGRLPGAAGRLPGRGRTVAVEEGTGPAQTPGGQARPAHTA